MKGHDGPYCKCASTYWLVCSIFMLDKISFYTQILWFILNNPCEEYSREVIHPTGCENFFKNSISVKKKIYTIVGKRKREMMALFHMFSVSHLFFILENCLHFTLHLWYLNCFSIRRGPRFHLLRLYLLKTKDITFL